MGGSSWHLCAKYDIPPWATCGETIPLFHRMGSLWPRSARLVSSWLGLLNQVDKRVFKNSLVSRAGLLYPPQQGNRGVKGSWPLGTHGRGMARWQPVQLKHSGQFYLLFLLWLFIAGQFAPDILQNTIHRNPKNIRSRRAKKKFPPPRGSQEGAARNSQRQVISDHSFLYPVSRKCAYITPAKPTCQPKPQNHPARGKPLDAFVNHSRYRVSRTSFLTPPQPPGSILLALLSRPHPNINFPSGSC